LVALVYPVIEFLIFTGIMCARYLEHASRVRRDRRKVISKLAVVGRVGEEKKSDIQGNAGFIDNNSINLNRTFKGMSDSN